MNRGKAMHILIADDEVGSREILAGFCRKEGEHHVVVAETGKDAWALLDDPKRLFDAVFLDVSMPDLSGLEILKRLKDSPLHRSTEVIVCTASKDRATITEAITAGAKHYLVKPCLEQVVVAKLKQIEETRAAAARPNRAPSAIGGLRRIA